MFEDNGGDVIQFNAMAVDFDLSIFATSVDEESGTFTSS